VSFTTPISSGDIGVDLSHSDGAAKNNPQIVSNKTGDTAVIVTDPQRSSSALKSFSSTPREDFGVEPSVYHNVETTDSALFGRTWDSELRGYSSNLYYDDGQSSQMFLNDPWQHSTCTDFSTELTSTSKFGDGYCVYPRDQYPRDPCNPLLSTYAWDSVLTSPDVNSADSFATAYGHHHEVPASSHYGDRSYLSRLFPSCITSDDWISNHRIPNDRIAQAPQVHIQSKRVKSNVCTHAGCESAFARKADLERHISVVHIKRKNYWCRALRCQKKNSHAFTRKDKYIEHLRKHHSGEEISCLDQRSPKSKEQIQSLLKTSGYEGIFNNPTTGSEKYYQNDVPTCCFDILWCLRLLVAWLLPRCHRTTGSGAIVGLLQMWTCCTCGIGPMLISLAPVV
jgi:hypothetical protein